LLSDTLAHDPSFAMAYLKSLFLEDRRGVKTEAPDTPVEILVTWNGKSSA